MVDLEFYGVSKNELEQHPQPALAALLVFFRRLDFDCRVLRTRVEARYDKERALDFGDICNHAALLFRLAPHLMEIDWVIGSLLLPEAARGRVAEGWADFFVRWGILPFESFLTSDRTAIRVGIEPGPAGGREVAWSGDGPYTDLAGRSIEGERLREELRTRLAARGIPEGTIPIAAIPDGPIGQLAIERALLAPLRESIECGETVEGAMGISRRAEGLFRIDHEAERFAEIVASRGDAVAESLRLARLVLPLERSLRFRASGTVNGFSVESAPIPLGRETGKVSILRDSGGMVRLALFARRGLLYRSRRSREREWILGGSSDAARVSSLLRRCGYLAAGADPIPVLAEDIQSLCDEIVRRGEAPARTRRVIPGERIVYGLAASPGRAAGPALLRTEGRAPAELDGRILVAETIQPEDNMHLYRASGIVSTGGGILSHAGLLALQFHKPALMIPARWELGRDGPRLFYRAVEFDEVESSVSGLAITMRVNSREHEEEIVDGDLVVLDARDATLRVLGHGAEPLALHHELRALSDAGRLLEQSTDDETILELRGRRLRARHLLERLLTRMTDIVIARHAVREILLADTFSGGGRGERAHLLSLLLRNPRVGRDALDHGGEVHREMVARYLSARETALALIPTSETEHEVLALRLETLRLGDACEETSTLLRECGWHEGTGSAIVQSADVDRVASARLSALRADAIAECIEWSGKGAIESTAQDRDAVLPGGPDAIRRRLQRIARIDQVLTDRSDPLEQADRTKLGRIRDLLAGVDAAVAARLGDSWILGPGDGGIELAPLAGSKAANLGEIERICGAGLVPPWFVVTDRAFRLIRDAPLRVGEAELSAGVMIDSILAREGTSDAQKAFLIRKVWEGLRFPDPLAAEIVRAYRGLAAVGGAVAGVESEEEPPVAVRSSGAEEDVEEATRAGEFETFLFIRGERDLLLHVKRVFASFWTERAIHNRPLFGGGGEAARGGVLVQRVVRSRVSGVVQTIHIAEGRMREIVVSAGLGLGEGIVSGIVGADMIVVSKEGIDSDAPLRFRYLTNDKREKVIHDSRRGSGTIRVETLYHERFRPALEYTELREIARAARRLERAYGIPLDIEFGIEGSTLRILQARPIPSPAATLRETVERHPLDAAGRQEGKRTGET